MKKTLILGGLVGCLTLLTLAETAHGQIFFGRRGFAVDTPWVSGEGGRVYRPYYDGYYGYRGYYEPYYGRGWRFNRTPYYAWYYNYPYDTTTSSGSSTAQIPGSQSYQSFYSGTGVERDKILLHVIVPDRNARVWIEEQPTQNMGVDRVFISPSLDPGKEYTYSIKATWMENGQEVTREKKLPARPGQEIVANFRVSREGNQRETGQPRERLPNLDNNRSNQSGEQNRNNFQIPERGTENPGRRIPSDIDQKSKFEDPGRVNTPAKGTSTLIEGKAVLIEGNQIVMENQDSKKQSIFKIKDDTQFIMDGKNADRQSVKPGMRVWITLKTDDPEVASKIEAKSGDTNNPKRPGGEP